MDQNQFDQFEQAYQSEFFTPEPPIKNAAYYRHRALELLKPVWKIAMLAFLIASLLGGVTGGGVSFNSSSETETEESGTVTTIAPEDLPKNLDELMDMLPPFAFVLFGLAAAALVAGLAFSIFVSSPVKVGYQRFNLDLVDQKPLELNQLFTYFKTSYWKTVGLSLLHTLFQFLIGLPLLAITGFGLIPTLWKFLISGNELSFAKATTLLVMICVVLAVAILTVVAYIFYHYNYSYTYMILAEYPDMRVIDTFRNSRMLMKGNKWKLFCVQISFIGWELLAMLAGLFTCGIGTFVGMLFLQPYVQATNAVFYDEIAQRERARTTEFPSIDPDDYDPNAEWQG